MVPENLGSALHDLSGMSMAKARLSKGSESKRGGYNQGNSVRGGVVVSYAEKTYRPMSAKRESKKPHEKKDSRQIFVAQ